MKTVGRFTYNKGIVSGPKEYMEDRGKKVLDRISNEGLPLYFTAGMNFQDIATAILVYIQTDYAAFAGEKQMLSWIQNGKKTK